MTSRYLAFPKAMKLLADRMGATAEEVAIWIFLAQSDDSPTSQGLIAYTNANELNPPPRFHFHPMMGRDYVSALMACWFKEEDIHSFEPEDRYITGQALVERWTHQTGNRPEAFIRAKIAESRLLDLHPITGGTSGTFSEMNDFPSLESGLFAMSHIEAIEAEDFVSNQVSRELLASPCQAVGAAQIRQGFKVIKDADANANWWKAKMRDAKRNGLSGCRVGEGKPGPDGSLWRPDLIAAWLVDRHGKQCEGLGSAAASNALKNFTGCEEVTEFLLLPEEQELP
jgi:hypothetical protein